MGNEAEEIHSQIVARRGNIISVEDITQLLEKGFVFYDVGIGGVRFHVQNLVRGEGLFLMRDPPHYGEGYVFQIEYASDAKDPLTRLGAVYRLSSCRDFFRQQGLILHGIYDLKSDALPLEDAVDLYRTFQVRAKEFKH